jgi:hypothetical protein
MSPIPIVAGRDVTPSASAVPTESQRFRVELSGLVIRLTPDINAAIVFRCKRGDLLTGLPQATQGGWTAVQIRHGDQVRRGWVATEWLTPIVAR